jgi:RsiW-degrading membrane proteinase PrsW (M82 family)
VTEESYLPPPPPETRTSEVSGFHGPKTNFFPGLRGLLARMESPAAPRVKKSLRVGLFIALLFSAFVGLILSILAELPFLTLGVFLVVGLGPVIEELLKALGMLVVAFVMWRKIPNRRYGAALGAAAGLGFGVAETILYVYGYVVNNKPLEVSVMRILITPLMHPLWSAFVGIGVFTLATQKQASHSTSLGVSIVFLFIGMVNHICWNGVDVALTVALAPDVIVPTLMTVVIVFPLFALMLRDFLGGHFNFQNFFEPLPERPLIYQSTTLAPPPPPPPKQ